MIPTKKFSVGLITALAISACGSGNSPAPTPDGEQTATVQKTTMKNDLLQEWTGPYGGVPAFDKMNLEELQPATGAGNGFSPAGSSNDLNKSSPSHI